MNLNKKHKTIKFDYKKISKKVEFLDTMVCKNQRQKRQQYSVNQRVNKHSYMHNRIIPNFLKTVFYTAKRYT